MANSPPVCRAVLDSNVLVAAHRSADPDSPNRELIERWQANEFTLLFSRDTLHEYAEKLCALAVDRADAVAFIALISVLGEAVEIEFSTCLIIHPMPTTLPSCCARGMDSRRTW